MSIKDNIKLAIKTAFYHTLTEKNIQKIIDRKEEEIKDIRALEKIEIEKIREEMYNELEGYYLDEEIEEMINETISKAMA